MPKRTAITNEDLAGQMAAMEEKLTERLDALQPDHAAPKHTGRVFTSPEALSIPSLVRSPRAAERFRRTLERARRADD